MKSNLFTFKAGENEDDIIKNRLLKGVGRETSLVVGQGGVTPTNVGKCKGKIPDNIKNKMCLKFKKIKQKCELFCNIFWQNTTLNFICSTFYS